MISKILAALSAAIIGVISTAGYGGIVMLMAIESACIPLPSEIIMPFSGYLVSQGRFGLFWVATAGAVGCNLGSALAYAVGYYGGPPMVRKFGRLIWLTEHELAAAQGFFARWGDITVFVARGPHLYSVAGRSSTYAAIALSLLHFFGIVAVVPGACLSRHEGGRALGLSARLLPSL